MIEKPDDAGHPPSRRCSFCKRTEAEAGHLVEGPGVEGGSPACICADCADLCSEILERQKQTLEQPPVDPSEAAAFADKLSRQLDEAVKNLDDIEFRIIELRYGLADGYSYTLEEVARALELTPERVREIEVEAATKLQRPS
jgi:RNA polymerase sigma factor (sigma-70 family)